MLRKISFSLMGVLCLAGTYAQDSTKEAPKATTISGSVDVYYRYNLSGPKTAPFNSGTSFTKSQNSFEIGMASVRLDHSFGKASATVDLGFGRRAQEFSYNDNLATETAGGDGFIALSNVKQAYVSYAVSDKFKLTMGKWGTHVGYELLDAPLNRNYSMSYMFTSGPFFHTGLKADISLTKKTALMVGIANPTDYSTTTSSSKFAIAQLSTATSNDKLKAYLNYQGGKFTPGATLNQFDLVVIGTVTDKFSVGYNGTVQTRKPSGGSSASWWGSAVYLNVDPTSKFGLTLRGEYFDDKKKVLGYNSSIFAATLSAQIKVDKLTIIPEFRFDNSSEEIFSKNDGTGTKGTGTLLLAAVYTF